MINSPRSFAFLFLLVALLFQGCSKSGGTKVGLRPSAYEAQAGSGKDQSPKSQPLSFHLTQVIETFAPAVIEVGDFDGDAAPDLVLGLDGLLEILPGTGEGFFDTESPLLEEALPTGLSSLAVCDLDLDGDLDLVLGFKGPPSSSLLGPGGPNLVYLNEGGILTDSGQRLGDDVTNALLLIDINEDSYPDLVSGNTGENRVRLNQGNGEFTPVIQSLGRFETLALAGGDFNGDGHIDLISGNAGLTGIRGIPEPQPDRVWLRHQEFSLVFPDKLFYSDRAFGNTATKAIAAGDFDQDGDLDLVVGSEKQTQLWLNDGNGFFEKAIFWQPPAFKVVSLDINGDGLPEILSAGPEGVVLYRNLGGLNFSSEVISAEEAFDVLAGDIDLDGSFEILASHSSFVAIYESSAP